VAQHRQLPRAIRREESVAGRVGKDWRRLRGRLGKLARRPPLPRQPSRLANKEDDAIAVWPAQVQNSPVVAQRTRPNEGIRGGHRSKRTLRGRKPGKLKPSRPPAQLQVKHRLDDTKVEAPRFSLANLQGEVLRRPDPVRERPSAGRKKQRRVLPLPARNSLLTYAKLF
jgi:hypothetical protein